MSLGRAAGPLLATICGVCTAYVALAPELQKQAAEKQQAQFSTAHDQQSSTSSTSTTEAQSSSIVASSPLSSPPSASASASAAVPRPSQTHDHEKTLSDSASNMTAEVKQKLQAAKSEVAAAEPRAGWFGLGAFASSFGGGSGGSSSKTIEKEGGNENKSL